MKLLLSLFILVLTMVTLSGCECLKMTDGGAIQRNYEEWHKGEMREQEEFMPQIRRWWATEKSRWPILKNECKDSKSCYDESLSAE